jgi:hypothetical protein
MNLRRTRAARATLTAAAGALLLAGCSRGEAAEDPTLASETATCSVQKVAQSPPEAELSNVFGLDVDSRGRIYAISSPGVAVLAPDGRLLRRLGRAGSGPGEFRSLIDVQVLPGDSVLTYDRELSRVTVFAPDSGAAAYSVSLLASAGLAPPARLRALPARRSFLAVHQRPAAAGGVDPGRQVLRVLDWNGALRRDSVSSFPAPGYVLIGRDGPRVSAGFTPFGLPNLVRLGRDGRVYFGRGDSLTVHVYSPDGRPSGGFAIPYTPPAIGAPDVEKAVATVKGNPILERAMREQAPKRWPAFQNFVVDDAGGVWVGLKQPADGPARWAVFDASGRRRCTLGFPEPAAPQVIRGGRVYAVVRDSLDVPSVAVYQLREQAKAGGAR